jgi:hypothetical protein
MCCCDSTSIFYWNGSSQSFPTIGVDVLLNTQSPIYIPENLLPTNGSTLIIEVFGSIPLNSQRALKLKIAGTTQTIWNLNGIYASPVPTFNTKIYLTRDGAFLRWKSESLLNDTQSLLTAGPAFVATSSINHPLELYINQSVAHSLQVGEVKITKIIKQNANI